MTDQEFERLGRQADPALADQHIAAADARNRASGGYRTIRDLPARDDVDQLRNLVGKTMLLYSVEPGTSRSMGVFTRWEYQLIIPETGELGATRRTFISFGQAITRVAGQLWGDREPHRLILNPPYLVKIATDGDVLVFAEP